MGKARNMHDKYEKYNILKTYLTVIMFQGVDRIGCSILKLILGVPKQRNIY
jgi:hypothetical protein